MSRRNPEKKVPDKKLADKNSAVKNVDGNEDKKSTEKMNKKNLKTWG